MVLGIDASQANREIRSGTEWYAFYLLQEFKKHLRDRRDIQVRLYTRGPLQVDLAADLPPNFEVRILPWPLRYFWGQLRLSWEMLVAPPDILFCPAHTIPLIHPRPITPPLTPSPLARDATSELVGEGKGRGGYTFTTLHDVGFMDYPELYDWRSRLYHRWSAKLAVNRAYHIFTVSEFSKERILENYDCSADKITVTYLGLDRNFAIEKSQSMNDYILYVGRLEPKKNILNLVKAYEMAEISQPLLLAGSKVNIKDVTGYLEARPVLSQKIKFLEYVSEEQKWQLYQNAAVFLFPTWYEGFGLPILEAQASGAPVITSNTASNPEIAGDGAVIVDPESPYEIAQAIKELLSSQALRAEKIQAGLENIKRFSWQDTARTTLEKLLADVEV